MNAHPITSVKAYTQLIKGKKSLLWQMNKCLQGIRPYVFRFKTGDVPEKLIQIKQEIKTLIEQREDLKNSTPKENWYPNFKNCGRDVSRESQVRTQIMREAFNENYNVKSIAAYFKVGETCVYRRINMQKLAGKMLFNERIKV